MLPPSDSKLIARLPSRRSDREGSGGSSGRHRDAHGRRGGVRRARHRRMYAASGTSSAFARAERCRSGWESWRRRRRCTSRELRPYRHHQPERGPRRGPTRRRASRRDRPRVAARRDRAAGALLHPQGRRAHGPAPLDVVPHDVPLQGRGLLLVGRRSWPDPRRHRLGVRVTDPGCCPDRWPPVLLPEPHARSPSTATPSRRSPRPEAGEVGGVRCRTSDHAPGSGFLVS